MTAQEKYQILHMRANSCTYDEIGKLLGISSQRAHQIVQEMVNPIPLRRKRYIYPNIARWMEARGLTQKAFAELLGCNQNVVHSFLTGKARPSYKLIKAVLKVTELPFEVAFAETNTEA